MYSCMKYTAVSFIFLLMFSVVSYWKIVVLHEKSSLNDKPSIVSLYITERLDAPRKTESSVKEIDLKDWEVEIQSRLSRVEHLCKNYHLGVYSWANRTNDLHVKDPPTPQYSYFFHNREKNFAWCPVYKAGSTTWLTQMMLLAGFTEEQLQNPNKQLSVLAREVYPEMDPSVFDENPMKLLVVRHPFERIVSAYRDKLSNSSVGLEHGTAYFYEKYGRQIVKKFRIDKTIKQTEPTFEEFTRYLIQTNLILYSDDHWLPAYYSCTPCRVKYDIIAKTETYMMDQKYIIEKASLNIDGRIKPLWKHQHQSAYFNNSSQVANDILAKKYFGQLTKFQIKSLYDKYFLDFDLFNYSPAKYLDYGRKDTVVMN